MVDSFGPARLQFVGNGTALMARDFVEQFGIRSPLFTDPDRRSYRAMGLQRSFGLGLKSLARGRRAASAGFRQGATGGDPWQQGGAALFDRDGTILWSSVDGGAGPLLDVEAIRGAVGRLAA